MNQDNHQDYSYQEYLHHQALAEEATHAHAQQVAYEAEQEAHNQAHLEAEAEFVFDREKIQARIDELKAELAKAEEERDELKSKLNHLTNWSHDAY